MESEPKCTLTEEATLQIKNIINEIDPDMIKCYGCGRTVHLNNTVMYTTGTHVCKSCAYDNKDPWESECLR